MKKRFQIFSVFGLFVFYLWIIFLMVNPNISEEYRAYYLERSTDDWRPMRYSATLSEGFDFSKPGLPSFIRLTSGISGHESWGRWTDARLSRTARIVYEESFLGDVCVRLKLVPAVPQEGKSAAIRVGAREERFVTGAGAPRWYHFDFRLDQPVAAIEIEPTEAARPAAWDPKNMDPREIGLGLYQLVVVPGRCNDNLPPGL